MDIRLAIAAAMALTLLAVTTATHHYALQALGRASGRLRLSRHGVVGFLIALIGVHLAQIALYAMAYQVGVQLGLGHLRGSSGTAELDFFYFAAETYSTLGYGDIVPVGALRLMASVEALNGLMLLAWSGSFVYGALERQDWRPPA